MAQVARPHLQMLIPADNSSSPGMLTPAPTRVPLCSGGPAAAARCGGHVRLGHPECDRPCGGLDCCAARLLRLAHGGLPRRQGLGSRPVRHFCFYSCKTHTVPARGSVLHRHAGSLRQGFFWPAALQGSLAAGPRPPTPPAPVPPLRPLPCAARLTSALGGRGG